MRFFRQNGEFQTSLRVGVEVANFVCGMGITPPPSTTP